MKYYLRRFILGIVTSPLSMALYALFYLELAMLGDGYLTWNYLIVNLPIIAWLHIMVTTFLPNLLKLVDKIIDD